MDNKILEAVKRDFKNELNTKEIVNKFNRQYPIGNTVMYKNGPERIHLQERKTKSLAFLSENNQPVVFFEHLAGYYSITNDFIDYSFF